MTGPTNGTNGTLPHREYAPHANIKHAAQHHSIHARHSLPEA